MALAAELDGKKHRIYCVASDGEHDEGNLWEAVMFAGKRRLHNLTVVVDRNNIQIDGYTENVMPLESLRAKYESFRWHVLEVNGHNIEEFVDAIPITQIISFAVIPITLTAIYNSKFLSLEKSKIVFIGSAIFISIQIIGIYILSDTMGIIGAGYWRRGKKIYEEQN